MISPSANQIYKEFEMLQGNSDKYIEKEKPIKPIIDKHYQNTCAKCASLVEDDYENIFNYCQNCGQKVDNSNV